MKSFLRNILLKQKMKQEQRKRRNARMRKKLSPEEYQAYLQKERKNGIIRNLITGAVVVVGILILFFILGKIGSLFRSKPVKETEPMTETETEMETEEVFQEKDIVVGATGTILLHTAVLDSALQENGNYDFSTIFEYVKPYYQMPDYMMCELVGTLGGPERGYVGGGMFNLPDNIITTLGDAGIDLQLLATDHIYNGTHDSLFRTMEIFRNDGLEYTGIRPDTSQKRYHVAEIDGVKIGILDYVYEHDGLAYNKDAETNIQCTLNGIEVSAEDRPLINTFDYRYPEEFYAEVSESIQQMKQEGVLFIITNMHWGTEYSLEVNDWQKEFAQGLCNLGVDVILGGGHSRCIEPIEVLESEAGGRKTFCIYSLGNQLSNQRKTLIDEMPLGHTEDGMLLYLTIHQSDENTVKLTDIEVIPTWVLRLDWNTSEKSAYYILPLDHVDQLAEKIGIDTVTTVAQASYDRTMEILQEGLDNAKSVFNK